MKIPDKLRADLEARFEAIQTHATDAGLSENSHKKINKAKKVNDVMVVTLTHLPELFVSIKQAVD